MWRRELLLVHSHHPTCFFDYYPLFSPDGRYVLLTGERAVFHPVDTNTGEVYQPTPDHVLEIQGLSFTPNGEMLVVASRDKVQSWDVKSGAPVATLEIEKWPSDHLVATVDDQLVLISGIRDRGVRLQNINSGARNGTMNSEWLLIHFSDWQRSPYFRRVLQRSARQIVSAVGYCNGKSS